MLKKNKGFTLVEVMIVVFILAILAAICVPFFLGLKENLDTNTPTNITVQSEESKVVEPKTTVKEPEENKIEEKDLKKL